MRQCLDDRELLDLREDDAPSETRAHAAACVLCSTRAAHLERDLALLTRVLMDAPLPPLPPRAPARRWLLPVASAASVIAGAVFIWSELPISERPGHTDHHAAARKTPETVSEESRLQELSRALFALDPLDPVVQLRRENELGLVQAALSGVDPCERRVSRCDYW